MADEFRWNIAGMGILPANFEKTTSYPLAGKFEGGLGIQYGPAFLEGGLEGSVHDMEASPLGVDHYDFTAPLNYTLSAGLEMNDSFTLRLGRYHYENTEVAGLLTSGAYSTAANFANIAPELGILGAEMLYHIKNDKGFLRAFKANLAYFSSEDRSQFGILEGLVTIGLGESAEVPTLTLAAYGAMQNSAAPSVLPAEDKGKVGGVGVAASFDYGIFSGIAGFTQRKGAFLPAMTEEHSTFSLAATLKLEKSLFRGSYSWINQATSPDSSYQPPIAENEKHFELSAGYQLNDAVLLSAGYRGIRGKDYDSNQLFMGIQSAFDGAVPFTQGTAKD